MFHVEHCRGSAWAMIPPMLRPLPSAMPWLVPGLLLSLPAPAFAADGPAVPILALEAGLAADGGHLDERVGVLLRAVEDPTVADEARVRLRTIVLDAPPRGAWSQAYVAALEVPDVPRAPVALHQAVAALQLPDPDPATWDALQALAVADVPGARLGWGDALLFHGRLSLAGDTTLVPPLHRAWAQVAAGQAYLATGTLMAPAAEPCLSTNGAAPCGALLLALGWPGAALARLALGLEEAPDDPTLLAHKDAAERALQGGDDPALDARAAEAEALRAAGSREEALALLQAACAEAPAAWPVLGPALGLAFELDQPEIAVALLQRALAVTRRPDGWASMLLDLGRVSAGAAETWKARGLLPEALAALQLAHVLLPDHPGVLSSLGGTAWQVGDPVAALAAYTAAEALAPGAPDVLAARFGLMVQLDQLDQAAELLAPLPVGDPSVDALRQELALELSVRSVRAQLQAGDVAGALQGSAQLLQRFDAWPSVQALRAEALLAAGEPRQAAVAYERARRGEPSNPWHAVGEARALGELSLWREAHSLLDGVEEGADAELLTLLGAQREALLRAQGDALRESGDWEAAWAHYEVLLAGSASAWTLTGAGALYLAAGRPEEARDAYGRALALDPDNPVPARGQVWTLLALGQPHEAERAALALVDQALADQSRDPANDALLEHARRQRQLQDGLVLRYSQRGDEAEALLLDALAQAPQDNDLALALGWLLEQEGRTDEAWWRAREVLVRDPAHPDALHLLRTVGAGRATSVHRAWQDAVTAGAGRDIADSLPALRLAIELERASELMARGLTESAREIVASSSRELAGGDAEAWLAVGGCVDRPRGPGQRLGGL